MTTTTKIYAKATLKHITPYADQEIAEIARVSNPSNQKNNETAPRLIRYLIDHNHWSPFQMASACVELDMTRDIGRQLLRHQSAIGFQEFSGRYAAYSELIRFRECRFQDDRNRQSSLMAITDEQAATEEWFDRTTEAIVDFIEPLYKEALARGVAKECARAWLPEGLVPSKIYFHGSIRTWIHYLKERLEPGVQKEHRVLAELAAEQVFLQLPMVGEALRGYIKLPFH